MIKLLYSRNMWFWSVSLADQSKKLTGRPKRLTKTTWTSLLIQVKWYVPCFVGLWPIHCGRVFFLCAINFTHCLFKSFNWLTLIISWIWTKGERGYFGIIKEFVFFKCCWWIQYIFDRSDNSSYISVLDRKEWQ